MLSERAKICLSYVILFLISDSQRLLLIISTNSFRFENIDPGLSTTAKISSSDNIFDFIVYVVIGFCNSFKESLQIDLKIIIASVR